MKEETFDLALSLGRNCRPAEYLRRLGLRRFTSPLDWMVTPSPETALELWRRGLKGWFENFELVRADDGSTPPRVIDRDSGCKSMHDFDPNLPLAAQLPDFQRKAQMRYARTAAAIRSSGAVALAAQYKPAQRAASEKLLLGMDELFPGRKMTLFLVEKTDSDGFSREERQLKENLKLVVFRFRDVWEGADSEKFNWLGHTEYWLRALSEIKVK